MSVASSDNVSQIKIGRVTEQSIAMMRAIRSFFNIQFKITEVEDDVYSESSEEEEEDQVKSENEDEEQSEDKPKAIKEQDEEKVQFPKTFIFSCVGVGLSNIARKTE